MIVAHFPERNGTICVLGLTADDTTQMMSRRGEPATIDFNEAVGVGIAIPTFLQIIYVKDREEFDQRILAWLATFGVDGTDMMIPFEKMPKVFGEEGSAT